MRLMGRGDADKGPPPGPDRMYLNLSCINGAQTSTPGGLGPPVSFTDARAQNVVDDASEYQLAIVRWSSVGLQLPEVSPEMDSSSTNPNDTVYYAGVSFSTGGASDDVPLQYGFVNSIAPFDPSATPRAYFEFSNNPYGVLYNSLAYQVTFTLDIVDPLFSLVVGQPLSISAPNYQGGWSGDNVATVQGVNSTLRTLTVQYKLPVAGTPNPNTNFPITIQTPNTYITDWVSTNGRFVTWNTYPDNISSRFRVGNIVTVTGTGGGTNYNATAVISAIPTPYQLTLSYNTPYPTETPTSTSGATINVVGAGISVTLDKIITGTFLGKNTNAPYTNVWGTTLDIRKDDYLSIYSNVFTSLGGLGIANGYKILNVYGPNPLSPTFVQLDVANPAFGVLNFDGSTVPVITYPATTSTYCLTIRTQSAASGNINPPGGNTLVTLKIPFGSDTDVRYYNESVWKYIYQEAYAPIVQLVSTSLPPTFDGTPLSPTPASYNNQFWSMQISLNTNVNITSLRQCSWTPIYSDSARSKWATPQSFLDMVNDSIAAAFTDIVNYQSQSSSTSQPQDPIPNPSPQIILDMPYFGTLSLTPDSGNDFNIQVDGTMTCYYTNSIDVNLVGYHAILTGVPPVTGSNPYTFDGVVCEIISADVTNKTFIIQVPNWNQLNQVGIIFQHQGPMIVYKPPTIPYFTFTGQNQLALVRGVLDSPRGTDIRGKIIMNEALFSMFSGFNAYETVASGPSWDGYPCVTIQEFPSIGPPLINGSPTSIYTLVESETRNTWQSPQTYPTSGNFNTSGNSDTAAPVFPYSSANYEVPLWITPQTFPCTDAWSDVACIVFLTQMQIQTEMQSPPNTGKGFFIPTATVNQSNTMTDMTLDLTGGCTDWLGKIVYNPSAEYRWTELRPGPIQAANFQVYWRSRSTNQLYQVTLAPGGSIEVKLLFQRRGV